MAMTAQILVLVAAIAAEIVGFEESNAVIGTAAQVVCLLLWVVFLGSLLGRRQQSCNYPRGCEPGCR